MKLLRGLLTHKVEVRNTHVRVHVAAAILDVDDSISRSLHVCCVCPSPLVA
jgi:hypothetical protein